MRTKLLDGAAPITGVFEPRHDKTNKMASAQSDQSLR